MKDLKKKLTAATAMLVVSAVMLSGVSYAWYTLSTNPEVKGITAKAVANENLEIALVKTNTQKATTGENSTNSLSSTQGNAAQGSKTNDNYTWGNLVDVTNLFTATSMELRPATYKNSNDTIGTNKVSDTGLYYPTYGDDGRIDKFNTLTTNPDYTNTTSGGLKTVDAVVGNKKTQYAFAVDYWMRTNVQGSISLVKDGTTRDNTNDKAIGSGSYVAGAAFAENGAYYGQNNAIKVVFHVVKEDGTEVAWKQAVNEDALVKDTNHVQISADNIFTADANQVYKVTMYVYLNGEVVTNADAAAEINNLAVNVQFQNSGMKTDNAAMKE